MKPEIPSTPADQEHRSRFTGVHDRNISVIAPAGVGKTRGIVDRILEIAQRPDAIDLLPRLVVVTYTQAAAQEMQSRARVGLRSANLPPRVQRAFQQTFFGTIHSFCVRLLSRFGHYLGLPGTMTLPRSDDEVWDRFLIHGAGRDPAAEEPALGDLFFFYTVDQLYRLGHSVEPGEEKPVKPLQLPDVSRLISYPLAGIKGSTKAAVQRRQEALQSWSEAWAKGDRFHAIPDCCPNPPEYVQLWRDIFAPFHEWLQQGALEFGRRVANDFAAFRLREGVMTYDDQVRLALAALKTPAAREELKRERWSVLLDEAQDTDKNQFDVLSRVAGLPDGKPEQAPGQTFCIVGDFQQAIWAPRSDLDVYREVHVQMLREGNGLEVQLTVTFRCDQAIIDFVNTMFAPLLDAAKGQAEFVQLRPRDGVGEGQVARWTCPPLPERDEKWNAGERAAHEAHYIATEMARLKPAGLGADDWSDVAILCPRVDWLRAVEKALRQADIDTQLHSGDETQAGSTPRAWMAALVWIAAHPEDEFEIVGALRDILGVSDDAMARFTDGDGELLRLDRPPSESKPGEVDEGLKLLRWVIEGVERIPLHLAVRQLMDRTRLRDRIVSLDEEADDLVHHEFDEILAQIDRRATEGATLGQLADELRDGLATSAVSGEEVRDGSVQLFSWHKAKGLEWQTVIVPFLYRSFSQKDSAYPRVIMRDGKQVVYRDKDRYEEEAKEFVQHRARQQFQRMLYVACTRPRHTLLLIDDSAVFPEEEQRNMPYCSAKLLRLEEETARATWLGLPEKIKRKAVGKKINAPAPELVPPWPPLLLHDFDAAIEAARAITKRVTPHALAKHPPPEAEPEVAAERDEPAPNSPAILYGTWWHEAMETLPWSQSREAWEAHMEAAFKDSPQSERSRCEWEILRESELAHWLETPGLIVHRELPFLLPETERCLEGVIDLAVYSPADHRWRVIDWKTNRTDSASLLKIYRGQIQAYVDAVSSVLDMPVEGGLYLTATGELTLLQT